MKLGEALEQVKELAKDKFYTIEYEIRDHRTIPKIQVCTVYVNDLGRHRGKTWEEAILKLKKAISDKKFELDLEELQSE